MRRMGIGPRVLGVVLVLSAGEWRIRGAQAWLGPTRSGSPATFVSSSAAIIRPSCQAGLTRQSKGETGSFHQPTAGAARGFSCSPLLVHVWCCPPRVTRLARLLVSVTVTPCSSVTTRQPRRWPRRPSSVRDQTVITVIPKNGDLRTGSCVSASKTGGRERT